MSQFLGAALFLRGIGALRLWRRSCNIFGCDNIGTSSIGALQVKRHGGREF
jgi:hypothetical protein